MKAEQEALASVAKRLYKEKVAARASIVLKVAEEWCEDHNTHEERLHAAAFAYTNAKNQTETFAAAKDLPATEGMEWYRFWLRTNGGTNEAAYFLLASGLSEDSVKDELEEWCSNFGYWGHCYCSFGFKKANE